MVLELLTFIQMAANTKDGGFDHGDINPSTGRLYLAHPGTDSVDIIDTRADKLLDSLPNFRGVAVSLAEILIQQNFLSSSVRFVERTLSQTDLAFSS